MSKKENVSDYPVGRPKGREYPSTNPFADRRKTRKRGRNADKKLRATYDRKRRMKRKIDKDIADKKKELKEVDREIETRTKLKELILKGPTPAEQRKAVLALMREHDFSPLEYLIRYCKNPKITMKEKLPILKHLSLFEMSKPKPHDEQRNADSNITVNAVDFTTVSKASLKRGMAQQSDDEYAEFDD